MREDGRRVPFFRLRSLTSTTAASTPVRSRMAATASAALSGPKHTNCASTNTTPHRDGASATHKRNSKRRGRRRSDKSGAGRWDGCAAG